MPKNIKIHKNLIIVLGLAGLLFMLIIGAAFLFGRRKNAYHTVDYTRDTAYTDGRPLIDVELLTPNIYSRPQIPMTYVRGIVIHYTANPGAGAQANRDYFEGLKDSGETSASSHFIVGLKGEIIQCIPTNEISYCSNERNGDTVAIEVCHPGTDGKFNDETYDSLVCLTGWLCNYLGVSVDDVIRHYDVTGKICPKYFVENEDAWKTFKTDVAAWIADEELSS